MRTKQEHLNAAVGNMLSTFTFKMGGVLDARRHMIHHTNATELGQLQRIYSDFMDGQDPVKTAAPDDGWPYKGGMD